MCSLPSSLQWILPVLEYQFGQSLHFAEIKSQCTIPAAFLFLLQCITSYRHNKKVTESHLHLAPLTSGFSVLSTIFLRKNVCKNQ